MAHTSSPLHKLIRKSRTCLQPDARSHRVRFVARYQHDTWRKNTMTTKLVRSLLFVLVVTLLSTGLYAASAGVVRAQATHAPVVSKAVTAQRSPALSDLPTTQVAQTSAAA